MTSARCRTGGARPGRLRGAALTAAVLVVLVLLALRLAEVACSSWTGISAAGPARPDDAVAALAASAALALTGWLLAAVVLSVVAAAAGDRSAAGRAIGRVTRGIAPLVLRNAVAAVLGLVVVTTPAVAHATALPSTATTATTAGSAGATFTTSSPSPSHTVRPTGVLSDLSPAWRVTDTPVTAPTAEVDSLPPGDLRPGWTPTQPRSTPGARTRVRRAAPVASAPRRSAVDSGDVVVQRGDTLWSIAARHLGPSATDAEIALDWPRWFSANRAVIGSDPDRLHPGERLRPPSANHHGGVR